MGSIVFSLRQLLPDALEGKGQQFNVANPSRAKSTIPFYHQINPTARLSESLAYNVAMSLELA
jgi:hypothetical protein